jgi:hypothetical protein
MNHHSLVVGNHHYRYRCRCRIRNIRPDETIRTRHVISTISNVVVVVVVVVVVLRSVVVETPIENSHIVFLVVGGW